MIEMPTVSAPSVLETLAPTPEESRHAEITRRLDQMVSELAALRAGLVPSPSARA